MTARPSLAVRIALIGANGALGRLLVRLLAGEGRVVTAIARSPEKLRSCAHEGPGAVADLEDTERMAEALADHEVVVSLAPISTASALLAAVPPSCRRIVATASMRTEWPHAGPKAVDLRDGERVFLASDRPGVMLKLSMIYGAAGDHNLWRIVQLVRRWPSAAPLILPLPGGGRGRFQPLHIDDLARCYAAAIDDGADLPRLVRLGGPEPTLFADAVRLIAARAGRRAHLLPVPVGLARAALRSMRAAGRRAPLSPDELARMAEDRVVDVRAMQALGVTAMPLERGIDSYFQDGSAGRDDPPR